MVLGSEPTRRGELPDGVGQALLDAPRWFEILDRAAGDADQMVVMVAGQLLGEFEAGELVAPHHPTHHAGLLENGQGAVGGALGQLPAVGDQLSGGEWPAGFGQGVDEGAPTRGVAMVDPPQPGGDERVKVVDHPGKPIGGICPLLWEPFSF